MYCTVKDFIVKTLKLLLTKRQYFHYMLIEYSGLANPRPIASVFWLDDALESRLRLDGIMCLVDCVNIKMQLRETAVCGDAFCHFLVFFLLVFMLVIDLVPNPIPKNEWRMLPPKLMASTPVGAQISNKSGLDLCWF
mmetsp:Transcript_3786/g.4131  ORF Transcript_3786/g.4131 Transcript_3786/m.4131 type:complete len:137 (-) Transcript_3786:44-454(-)